MNWGDKSDIRGRNIFSSLHKAKWLTPAMLNCWRFSSEIFIDKCSLTNPATACVLLLHSHIKVFWVFWVVQTYNHTHTHTHTHIRMKPHRELLRCRSGRKTKADRSERRYNQPWVLRKKRFAPSFQSSFTSSHLNTIFLLHHHHRSLLHPSLCGAHMAAGDAGTNRPSSGLE